MEIDAADPRTIRLTNGPTSWGQTGGKDGDISPRVIRRSVRSRVGARRAFESVQDVFYEERHSTSLHRSHRSHESQPEIIQRQTRHLPVGEEGETSFILRNRLVPKPPPRWFECSHDFDKNIDLLIDWLITQRPNSIIIKASGWFSWLID